MTHPENMMLKSKARSHVWRWLAGLGLLVGLAGAAQAQTPPGFSYSGAEVTDSKTGLIWQRCSAGQSWSSIDSTCTGTAAVYTHEDALIFAKSQTVWRLPNVKELSSITDKTRSKPAIDEQAFPKTPPSWFWSASPQAFFDDSAWYVNFVDGSFNYFSRGSTYHVRLVR